MSEPLNDSPKTFYLRWRAAWRYSIYGVAFFFLILFVWFLHLPYRSPLYFGLLAGLGLIMVYTILFMLRISDDHVTVSETGIEHHRPEYVVRAAWDQVAVMQKRGAAGG